MNTKPSNRTNFIVVGIGASAGGLDAIQILFDNLPSETGMAFVIVQHLSPTFKSLMNELLAKHTQMPIKLAENGIEIEPNHIYLNPRESNIIFQNGKIIHQEKDNSYPLNLPIDIFFHSLASELEHRAIGVVLSGTGTDGSRGISTIKENGGTVIVQDPKSAQFDGMPITAINTQFTDYILPPDAIGEELVRLAGTPRIEINYTDADEKDSEGVFHEIVKLISKQSGIDFSHYKPNTIIRRIEKRIAINQLESLEEYYKLLKANDVEKDTLAKECLIGVTAFFRDPEAFNKMRELVFPRIFTKSNARKIIRFWVIGCSTGEEAYSLAILVEDYLQKNNLYFDYKIFSTDVDKRAIGSATSGHYAINQLSDLSKEQIDKYFTKKETYFEVSKRIREKIVFSTHNILKDPPFIRIDLITCRNLLIYIKNKSQVKLLNTFQFSLNRNGFLMLGNSENIQDLKQRYEVIDSKWRIYMNISDVKMLPTTSETRLFSHSVRQDILTENMGGTSPKMPSESVFNRDLAEKFGPDCIYINSKFDVLFINGNASSYLTFKRGSLKQNLLEMVANEKLAALIRNGIRRLIKENKTIIIERFLHEKNSEKYFIDIRFYNSEIVNADGRVFIVLFEYNKEKTTEEVLYDHYDIDKYSQQRIIDLESELQKSKEETQNVIEELETSNEELQASNEELQASNEELQSTNEELQSVNEELYTVNAELQSKNRELYDLNNDMKNLLDNTDMALLFLNQDLKIRMYTPELKNIFNLRETDIDRPIEVFASNFINISGKQLAQDVRQVIKSGKEIKKQLETENKRVYLKRIIPYRVGQERINGAVITFLDITDVKQNSLVADKND